MKSSYSSPDFPTLSLLPPQARAPRSSWPMMHRNTCSCGGVGEPPALSSTLSPIPCHWMMDPCACYCESSTMDLQPSLTDILTEALAIAEVTGAMMTASRERQQQPTSRDAHRHPTATRNSSNNNTNKDRCNADREGPKQ